MESDPQTLFLWLIVGNFVFWFVLGSLAWDAVFQKDKHYPFWKVVGMSIGMAIASLFVEIFLGIGG